MTGLIRPTNVSAPSVTIPSADPNSGNSRMLGPNGNAIQQSSDPLAYVRNMFSAGSGAAGSGSVDWSRYDNPSYNDPVLQAIQATGSNIDENSNQYYIARVSGALATFIQQIMMRNGLFYQWYTQTVDTFKIDPAGNPCPISERFVEVLKKRPEISVMIARNASIYFGHEVITRMRNKNAENLNQTEYGQAAEVATRMVLFFELVGWLTKTETGRSLSYNLPKSLMDRINNVDKFKEFGISVFQMFGVPFPYDNLTFEVKVPVAQGYGLMPQVSAYHEPDYGVTPIADLPQAQHRRMNDAFGNELVIDESCRLQALSYKLSLPSIHAVLEFENKIRRRLNPLDPQDVQWAVQYRNQELSSEHQINIRPMQNTEHENYLNSHVIKDLRTDFQNMTLANREAFDWRAAFVYAGEENKYLIKDELWQKIKKVLKDAQPEEIEESFWGSYCYRVVRINLQSPDVIGYHSYLVRDKLRRFTQMQTFTDPAQCLPVLEADDNGNVAVAHPVKVNDLIPADELASFIIPAAEVKALEGTVPVIVNTDPISSNNHHSIKVTVKTINDRLTTPLAEINGTSMDVGAMEEFHCEDPSTKVKLLELLPFLFDDNYFDLTERSYFEVIEYIEKTFRFENLDSDVTKFIRYKLTRDFNNWLISGAGFNPVPGAQGHLSSNDILDEIEEVKALFKENDQSLYDYLDKRKFRSSLMRKMCMFVVDEVEYEEVAEIEIDEETGKEVTVTKSQPVKLPPVEQLKLDTTLYVVNRIHFTTINRTPSPQYTPHCVINIKRSSFPEIFSLVEEGFKQTYQDDVDFVEIDKVVRFSLDDNYWVFTPSAYDPNVAQLRHLTVDSDLFMLDYN